MLNKPSMKPLGIPHDLGTPHDAAPALLLRRWLSWRVRSGDQRPGERLQQRRCGRRKGGNSSGLLSWITSPSSMFLLCIYIYIILSKEVGKQYFRVTNDFYLMKLTMMKGGT